MRSTVSNDFVGKTQDGVLQGAPAPREARSAGSPRKRRGSPGGPRSQAAFERLPDFVHPRCQCSGSPNDLRLQAARGRRSQLGDPGCLEPSIGRPGDRGIRGSVGRGIAASGDAAAAIGCRWCRGIRTAEAWGLTESNVRRAVPAHRLELWLVRSGRALAGGRYNGRQPLRRGL